MMFVCSANVLSVVGSCTVLVANVNIINRVSRLIALLLNLEIIASCVTCQTGGTPG